MIKKSIALLIAFSLIYISSASCSANDSEEWKENTGKIDLSSLSVSGDGIAVEDNIIKITSGGDFEVVGSLNDGMIYVDSDQKVKLRLSGMSLNNTSGPAICFENAQKAFITITEETENYLSDSSIEYTTDEADAVLFSNDDLEIKGNGFLCVEAGFKHAIASDDELSIQNGNITISAKEHGIKVNDKFELLSGNIKITTQTGKGIKADEEVLIEDGILDINSYDEAIESKGILTINGGDIKIVSQEDGINTGIESDESTQNKLMPNASQRNNISQDNSLVTEEAQNSSGEMGFGANNRGHRGQQFSPRQNQAIPHDFQVGSDGEIQPPPMGEPPFDGNAPMHPQGGNFSVDVQDINQAPTPGRTPANNPGQIPQGAFGRMIDEESAASHSITINGGNIHIMAKGDCIDSNGNLTINGGNIVIDDVLQDRADCPLDSDGTMTLSGGEITIVTSSERVQMPSNEDIQNIIRITFDSKGETGDVIELKDSSGTLLASHTAQTSYTTFLCSSSSLKTGENCFIYKNGALESEVEITEGITTIGNITNQNFMGTRGQRNNANPMEQKNRDTISKDKITVTISGNPLEFDVNPIIKNDTTLVAFRTILEALGASVMWDEATQTVTAKKDDVEIVLTINCKQSLVNGKSTDLAVAPEIINGRTMIPVRFISEQMGMNVQWDHTLRCVKITEK